MSTNNLPLQDADLDLVSAALDAYYMRAITDQSIPLEQLQRMHVLTEELWHAQAQRDAGGPVCIPALERYLRAQGKTA